MLLHLAIFTAALAEDLQVSSNVSGLSIVVNGEDTGLRTPATVRNVGAGSTVVQVGDSCRSGTAMTEVRAGARNEVTVRAEEQLATLEEWISSSGADRAGFLSFVGVERLSDLPAKRYDFALGRLRAKAGVTA